MQSRVMLSAGALATSALLLFSTGALADSPAPGGNNGAGAGRETTAPPATVDYHNGNRGDVWMEEGTGEVTPTTGHENDPHFACNVPLNIMGDKMGDSGGYFSIVPQGGNGGPSTYSGTWSYGAQGGIQVIARIPAGTLAAGHYKLDLSQDPQKHKVFWIEACSAAVPAGGAVQGGTSNTGTTGGTQSAQNGTGGTEASTAVTTATGAPAGTAATGTVASGTVSSGTVATGTHPATGGGVAAPATSATAGAVLAETASIPLIGGAVSAALAGTGAVLADTGTPLGLLVVGIVLLAVGLVLFARRRRTVL